MIRQFVAGEIQIVLKHMESCLASFVIRERTFKQLPHHRQKLRSQKITCIGKDREDRGIGWE